MKNKFPIACFALRALALPNDSYAQFTGNSQTNIISGVTNNWPVTYYVGSNYVFDALLIQNGGSLSNSGWGIIGYTANARSNTVIVSDSGSVWSKSGHTVVGYSGAGNRMVISNGGVVSDIRAYLAYTNTSSSNSVLVTGSGSAWTNYNDLFIGYSGAGNNLTISNGGAVASHAGSVGYNQDSTKITSSNNSVVVTGAGSAWTHFAPIQVGSWSAGNSLVISDGGTVVGGCCFPGNTVGSLYGGNSNSVLVTGSGSVWSNLNALRIGWSGVGNTMVISNGGTVVSLAGYVGDNSAASNNSVVVTGNGSVWKTGFLELGPSSGNNVLTIADSGSVIVSNAYIIKTNNRINVSGGNLFATNASGSGFLDVRPGILTCDSGMITADTLLVTNGSVSVIAFNGGLLNSKSTSVTNAQQFVVGNGTNSATFHLLGGVHSFNDGLRIRTNSFLTGCGTINGRVTINPGGAVHANCTNLVFNSSVTNNGAMVADGAVLESFGTLVNNGKIFLLHGGTTNFHGTFINNGMILNGDIHLAIQRDGSGGFFIRFTGAPDVTYRLQRAASVTGTWTNLATNTALASGLIEYHETSPPPGQAFYRAVQP